MFDVLRALGPDSGDLVVAAPAPRPHYWAGAPSAVVHDGIWWLAYRLRRPVDLGRGYANVVARSLDGVRFETVATVTSASMVCASLERPALVLRPDGGWRLYVSCSTPGSKHWWVEAIDAWEPAELADGKRTVVLPGSASEAWKDVVVRVQNGEWEMWACRHPLDHGDDEADRMTTWYATSPDGLSWTMRREALRPGGGWDRRGARVTSVLPDDEDGCWGLYDGRASADDNWFERTGLARGRADALSAVAGPVPAEPGLAVRYTSVVDDGAGLRAYFETTGPNGSHDLRTVYVPRPIGESQSV